MSKFCMTCSLRVFTREEKEILNRYGQESWDLMTEVKPPRIDAEKRSIQVYMYKVAPKSIDKRCWTRYLKRVKWKKDPSNLGKMGVLLTKQVNLVSGRDDYKKSTQGRIAHNC